MFHRPKIELIDFGATREYTKEFIDNWRQLLTAAIKKDREACIEWSRRLKYLIGGENEVTLLRHILQNGACQRYIRL